MTDIQKAAESLATLEATVRKLIGKNVLTGELEFPRGPLDVAMACLISMEMGLAALKQLQQIRDGLEAATAFKAAEQMGKVGRA